LNFGLQLFLLLEWERILKIVILFHLKLCCSSGKLLRLPKWTNSEKYLIINPHLILIILLNIFYTEKIFLDTVYKIPFNIN